MVGRGLQREKGSFFLEREEKLKRVGTGYGKGGERDLREGRRGLQRKPSPLASWKERSV